MASHKSDGDQTVTASSGNVFADLGFADAAERQTKVRLAFAINQILEGRRLSPLEAGPRLGIDQRMISALSNYRLDGFSVERLMHFLVALDQDIEIVIRRKPHPDRPAKIVVTASAELTLRQPKATLRS